MTNARPHPQIEADVVVFALYDAGWPDLLPVVDGPDDVVDVNRFAERIVAAIHTAGCGIHPEPPGGATG